MPGGFPFRPELCRATDVGTNLSTNEGVQVTSGSSANAYGAWTTLVAAAPFDVAYIDCCFNGEWIGYQGSFQIGVGASGSEAIIAADFVCYGGPCNYHFPLPCAVPAGTRIAARTASSGNANDGYPRIQLTLFDGSFSGPEACAGVDSIGYVASSAGGTTIDPGGTALTKGSYYPLTLATPRDYAGIFFVTDRQNNVNSPPNGGLFIDLAIGASGSEIVIVPDILCIDEGNAVGWAACPTPIYWRPIPSGTRVAARAGSTNSSSPSRLFGLTAYGIYK
jgi:hypothetical protein